MPPEERQVAEYVAPSRWRRALTYNLPLGFVELAQSLVTIGTLGYCPQGWVLKFAIRQAIRESRKRARIDGAVLPGSAAHNDQGSS